MLGWAAVASLAIEGVGCGSRAGDPDVLVITIDTLRADRVSTSPPP